MLETNCTPPDEQGRKVIYFNREITPEITDDVVTELQGHGFEVVDVGAENLPVGEELHDYRMSKQEEVEALAEEYERIKKRKKLLPLKIGALAMAAPVASFGLGYGLARFGLTSIATGMGVGTVGTVWSEVGAGIAAGAMYDNAKSKAHGAATKARDINRKLAVPSNRWITDELNL